MKLTFILLTAAFLQVSAKGTAQTLSLKAKNEKLEKVFGEIKAQTGFLFFYSTEDMESAKPVTVELTNVSIDEALKKILADEPLLYVIKGNTVFIKAKVSPTSEFQSKEQATQPVTAPAPIDISGHVTDKDGKPLEGASVLVKGTKNGTTTDVNGVFILKNVSAGDQIVVSYSGYQSQTLTAGTKTSFSIVLEVSQDPLDQVQIIAYGSQSRRNSVGDVTTVSSEDIEKQPVNNPLLALEGRVPGVNIIQSTGFYGSGVTVNIQGINSIAGGTDPLYVIDGVPYLSQMLPTNFNAILGTSGIARPTVAVATQPQNGSALSYINPDDIETISVLKDADATAIYGSRAANGAVIITTKKGRKGPVQVDINLQSGIGQEADNLSMLNTQQYLAVRRMAKMNSNTAISSTDYDINGFWDQSRYTDWQKVLLGGNAKFNDFSGTISGGTNVTQYLISGTYHRETTVFPTDMADGRGSVHFSLGTASTDQKFKMQLTGNYLNDKNSLPNTDYTSLVYGTGALPPDAPPLRNADGTLNWVTAPNGFTSWNQVGGGVNPLALLYKPTTNFTRNLIGNALASYEVIPGLTLKASLGYNNLENNEVSLTPSISYDPAYLPIYGNATRSAQFANNSSDSWIIEPQLSYHRTIDKGTIDALAGGTIQQLKNIGESSYGTGYTSDLLLNNPLAAANYYLLSTVNTEYKYNAVFGRANYIWNNKYILDATVRRDGSSRFGSENQFHNFWSAGAGWIFSEENTIKNNLPWLSFGKLHVSYGTTGNDQIGEYQFLNLYSSISASIPYQGQSGLSTTNLPNPYLKWEETRKLQGGVDLGFFNERLLLNADYFRNRSSTELLTEPLSFIAGYPSILTNLPATVQNTGWEISLSGDLIRSRAFRWTSAFTITVSKNKLLSFPGLAQSSYASYLVVGEPITVTKVYHFLGVDPTTGIYEFETSVGNPTSSPGVADKTTLINTLPKFYGGWQNSLNYKGFELAIFLQYAKQIGQNYLFTGSFPGSGSFNSPTDILNVWQQPGDSKPIQKYFIGGAPGTALQNARISDAAYTDASYIRLKNLSLSWQLPTDWNKAMHLRTARLFMQGQNLLTFTDYFGLDPETRSSSILPPLRIMTIGVNIGL